ncbi:MAG: hypothetical protein B6I36_10140 [Desulfobacteraceae bacterium 4572_35.1]|nr:MAG: hypothetical protein B6I36_10140 [Desulfobacteraceae bacterium 4572_35.1]
MTDSSLLNKVSRAQREQKALNDHPLVEASLDVRLKYLSALSLVLCIDNLIHWREKQYLQMMMHALGVPRDMLDAVLIQGKDWDESMIKEVISFVKHQKFDEVLLLDLALASVYDGWFHPNERKLLDLLKNWLHIDEQLVGKLKIITALPFKKDLVVFYHENKGEFCPSDPVMRRLKSYYVGPLFSMICDDLKWKNNRKKRGNNDQ